MNRICLIILAIIFPFMCFALKVTYLTTYRLTNDGPLLTSYNTLVVDSLESSFYSEQQLRQIKINDSLKVCDASPYEAVDIWKHERLFPHTNFAVFKNYPSNGLITVTDEMMYFYFYEEPMPEFKWDSLAGDTTIMGHVAHKAKTKYRGRIWTVYYTLDIPISDGPWKLCGLPGLILCAKDSLGDFSFEATGIVDSFISYPVASSFIEKSRQSTVSEMARLRRLMFRDESQFNKKVLGKSSQLFDAQGHPLPPAHQKACLIEFPIGY